MQQHSGPLQHRSDLSGTFRNGDDGGVYLCNVFEKLLTFLVLRTPQECTDKRFDCVIFFSILKRLDGPARHELLLKILFPPVGCTKERNQFVRHVLETASTEVPEDSSEFVVGIHGRLPLSIGVPLTAVL